MISEDRKMSDRGRLAAPETAGLMTAAAAAWLAALTEAQREKACLAFGDGRREWSFLPVRDRGGLPIGTLDDGQRRLAHELIVTGTSLPGYAKVVSVMAMEHVLRALTPARADLFNPERYCFKVFGTPGSAAWGWQLAGHHVSLNFTIVSGRYISPTPCLLGAEPAGYGTLAPLADDEELGYRFVNSLDAAQRRAAIIHHRPPPDLATRIVPRIGATERPDPVFGPEPDYVLSEDERDILSYVRASPKGISAAALDQRQLDALGALVGAFARRLPDEVAGAQMHDIERAGMDNLTFAWAGRTEPGQRHYFRIQGPGVLIEHDNTQGNGNHIHSVWRNPADDFGDDVLAEHYRLHHAGAAPALAEEVSALDVAHRFGEDGIAEAPLHLLRADLLEPGLDPPHVAQRIADPPDPVPEEQVRYLRHRTPPAATARRWTSSASGA
jgi:hypothetical protein